MSDQTSHQGSFTTPVTHLPVPPSSVHDFPSPSPSPCTSSSELQSPAPSQYKQLSTQLGSSGGTKAEQKPSSPAIAPSPRRPPRSPAPTPKSGPSSPPTSPDSSNQFEKSTPQANRPRQLPTDSLSFRLTPGQIRQKMKDQAKKQTTEILMATSNEPEQMPPTSLATSRRDMPADSVSMWVTAAKVKEKLREEELRTQQIQDPPTLKNLAPPSLPEQAPFTALESSSSAASIKRVAWERDNPQQMPEPPSVQIQPPPPAQLLKQGSPTMAKKSSVTDSVPMWLTPEMIKQMAIEEESRQLGEDSNAPAQKMTTIQQGPPQSKPAVQKQPPLPAQRRDMPADSISMWMTPAKVKKMMMEESQKQQNDPPKALRRDLPTDSVSLWMTPAKLKQMALEENSRSQVQETIRPLIIGEELRKPIAKIEEEPEASMIDDEELSIHIPGPSTSTKRALPADSLSLYQVKKIMEAKAQKSIPGFVPSSSASAAVGTVEEAELRKPIAKIEEESEASLIGGEELSVQMPRPSTSTKRALPADSLSLYQVKKIMEAKAKQSISGFVPLSSTPAALGTIEEAELRKPIAKIEEESEASVIDDEELSIQMPGPSTSTKRALPADSLSLYQVKKIMEAKAQQSNPGFVPLSSASQALGSVEEADAAEEDPGTNWIF
ncbi:hypothetical protein MARPO_0112s0053 [Marchantia polymorpha]|uniref:Uncharacterized protein n=1 Tax=Marchantia polymorpha TaxID=3197 RepID=A0A2R6WC31_MARPO|nr:hypothetical protein MARPO_0112s0053 [Marchantia polymorpha]|eukprot:PTQ31411.1 hypothetical protein MARPO_0112s0053 [Marchantia polymorpha]